MAPMEQHFETGPFLVLSKSNGRLQATWHSGSELLVSAIQLVQGFIFVVFRILSVTCSLTRALSQSLALRIIGALIKKNNSGIMGLKLPNQGSKFKLTDKPG